eukprot:2884880-Lingulodinium_polyedra.AAC.1
MDIDGGPGLGYEDEQLWFAANDAVDDTCTPRCVDDGLCNEAGLRERGELVDLVGESVRAGGASTGA